MCFACCCTPEHTIDFAIENAKKKHRDRLEQAQFTAAFIKEWFRIIDEENTKKGESMCSQGDKNIEVFKQKMYEIAREI